MSSENYYDVLEAKAEDDAKTIKKNYRSLAMKYHPDTNKDDKNSEDKFKKIAEAYEVLSDEQKRAAYDRMGHERFTNPNASRREGRGDVNLDDLMNHMWSQNFRGQRRPSVQSEIKVACRISLKDAITGGEIGMRYERSIACEKCHGQGHLKKGTCSTCNGTGTINQQIQENMYIKAMCGHCNGTGSKLVACAACGQSGYKKKVTKLNVKIPEGVSKEAVLKVSKKGNVVFNQGKKVEGSLHIVIDYPSTEDGVTLNNGHIYLSVQTTIDRMLAEDKIVADLGFKEVEFKLNSKNPSGHEYKVLNCGSKKGKHLFIKVFADFPKNSVDEKDREKLVNVWREVYGKSNTTVKPSTTRS